MDGWTALLPLSELSEGRPTLALAGTRQVLLIRSGDAVHACDPVCPHKFTSLEDGHLEEGCLVCPLHDAHFDLDTGAPRAGDEWAGNLPVYESRVEGGTVEVRF